MQRVRWILLLAVIIAVPAVSAAQTTGYDGGFFIKNDEGTFKLKFNGRFQPKVEFRRETLDDVANNHYKKRTSFSIRRAQFVFSSTIHEQLSFNLVMQHGTNSQNFNTVNVALAAASLEVAPEFIVTAGMTGLPLSIMAETSSKWFLLAEPPLTELQDDGVADFTIARASFSVPDGLGVNFAGDISKFFYSISAVNGGESNYAFNPGNKFSFGARFGVNILDPVPGSQTDFECSEKPKLTVSAGSMYQAKRTDPNTAALLKYLWTSSAGVALRWGGFAITTEGYYRRTKVDNPGNAVWARPTLTDIGYYGAAGYYIVPKKFEIAGQAGQIFREGPDNNSNQFGGGLNYYIFDNNLKLQLSYTWTEDYDDLFGASANNQIHNIALMATALF